MFIDKRRGDVWWLSDSHRKPTDTRLTRGDRPALVVSRDEANQTNSTVLVIPFSASPAQLARGDGTYDNVLLTGYPAEDSAALTRQLHAVDAADLTEYLYHLTDADMARVAAALRRALGL